MNARTMLITATLFATPVFAHSQTSVRTDATARVEARGAGPERGETRGSAEVESRARLEVARESLGREGRWKPSEPEVAAGAEALASGAAAADLRTLRDRAPEDRQLTASLRTLARMSARGDDSATAAAAIAARLEAGAGDRAITSLTSGASAGARGALEAGVGADALLRGAGGGLGATAGAVLGVGGILP